MSMAVRMPVDTLAAEAGPPSFDDVFHETSPYVFRALRRFGVRPSDLDDVAQDVFVIVHKRLSTYEGRGSICAFVYGIAFRVASDYRRSARVRRESVAPSLELVPSREATDPIEDAHKRELLDRLLAELDEAKLGVFVLYEIEELTMQEVARAVGCSVPTAYARLAAGRRELKKAMRRAIAKKEWP
jgi:RNA polymerase sigma-70 factor (ECF subfamily)